MKDVLIQNVKVGDYVLCSCPTGCFNYGCTVSCNPNNKCANKPKFKKVIDIIRQPAAHTIYFQLDLEGNMFKYGWLNTMVTLQ